MNIFANAMEARSWSIRNKINAAWAAPVRFKVGVRVVTFDANATYFGEVIER